MVVRRIGIGKSARLETKSCMLGRLTGHRKRWVQLADHTNVIVEIGRPLKDQKSTDVGVAVNSPCKVRQAASR
jgi:hypothetical protein